MPPPVQPKTLSIIAYLALTLLLLSSLAVMMTVDTGTGLVQAAIRPLRQVVKPVSCEPLAENDGKLIHIDCPIRRLQSFSNVAPDFAANLPPFRGVFFEMKVEMYQSSVMPGMLRSSLGGIWSDSLIRSPTAWNFWNNKRNPDYFPSIPGSGRHFGSNLYGGGYRLEKPHLVDFHEKMLLALRDDGVFFPSSERPPLKLTSASTRVYEDRLYSGDPLDPKIGDVRISFYGSRATHLSAIGKQVPPVVWSSDRTLKGFADPLSRSNKTRTLVAEGDYTLNELLDSFAQENDIPNKYIWCARSVAFLISVAWAFFTLQLIRRDTGKIYSKVNTLAASLVIGLSICMTLVGLTKLTYSLLACIVCLITACFLYFMSYTCRVPKSAEVSIGYTQIPQIEPEEKPKLAPLGDVSSAGRPESAQTSYVAL